MTNNVLGHYTQWMKVWPKQAGPKVSEQELNAIHALGARPGSKATLAAAMYTRKDGATQAQVVQVVGGPQLNVMRRLLAAGQCERVATPKNEAGHTVYRIKLIKGAAKKGGQPKATASAKGGKKADGDGKDKAVQAKPKRKPSKKQEQPAVPVAPSVAAQSSGDGSQPIKQG